MNDLNDLNNYSKADNNLKWTLVLPEEKSYSPKAYQAKS